MIRRSTRLQQLYEKEMEGWESRLREKGLSIYKNKVWIQLDLFTYFYLLHFDGKSKINKAQADFQKFYD